MSIRGSTKSNVHRKMRHVESGGTGRKFAHHTRGALHISRYGEVSRGRMSEEADESQSSKGPKDHETDYIPYSIVFRMVRTKESLTRVHRRHNSSWITGKYINCSERESPLTKGMNAGAE